MRNVSGALLVCALTLLSCTGELGSPGTRASNAGGGAAGGVPDQSLGAGGPGAEGHAPRDGEDGHSAAPLRLVDPLVRRLTKHELRFSLEDTFDIEIGDDDLSSLPDDRPLEGFANVATTQTVLPEHVAAYFELSEMVADRLQAEGKLLADAPCTEDTSECAEGYVRGLGKRLFRAPPRPHEVEAFGALLLGLIDVERMTFSEAAHAVFRAMFQSPQFLYRLESETAADSGTAPGEERRVVGYEMASRLSYAVWSSAPDEALMDAAEAGLLDTPDGVGSQLSRLLLDTERCARATRRYMTDWARLEALPDDGGLKRELTDSLVASYDHMIWELGLGPLEALSEDELLLTGTLAEHLGLEPVSPEMSVYDLGAAPGRVGLLSHPGLIAGMTNADGGAIVARGLFLQSQLFCGETPEPPQAIQDAIDAFLEEIPEDASDRYVAEIRLERPECGGCHSTFDPLSYALEQFDYQGRFRQQDEHQNPLSTDGWIPAVHSSTGSAIAYEGLEEYAALLSSEPKVQRCLILKHLEFLTGTNLGEEQMGAVEGIQTALDGSVPGYEALVRAITESRVFYAMKVE